MKLFNLITLITPLLFLASCNSSKEKDIEVKIRQELSTHINAKIQGFKSLGEISKCIEMGAPEFAVDFNDADQTATATLTWKMYCSEALYLASQVKPSKKSIYGDSNRTEPEVLKLQRKEYRVVKAHLAKGDLYMEAQDVASFTILNDTPIFNHLDEGVKQTAYAEKGANRLSAFKNAVVKGSKEYKAIKKQAEEYAQTSYERGKKELIKAITKGDYKGDVTVDRRKTYTIRLKGAEVFEKDGQQLVKFRIVKIDRKKATGGEAVFEGKVDEHGSLMCKNVESVRTYDSASDSLIDLPRFMTNSGSKIELMHKHNKFHIIVGAGMMGYDEGYLKLE